jgi:putative ABC transport system permease protein
VAKVITKLENAHLGIENTEQLVPCYVFIVDSEKTLEKIVDAMQSGNVVEKRKAATYDYVVQFDTNLTKEQSIAMSRELDALDLEGVRIVSDNRYEMAEEFHQMYGGFLFIGMFVGSLFLMATVLIIYYKQISEGYEDKARFEIMQKVGMSRAEVKKTIRSQVLMVFFIPLIMAAIHIVVSFRIIKMILSMLNLGNVNLFMWCTLGTVLVFCVIYAIVFAITERAYYKIVSIGNK